MNWFFDNLGSICVLLGVLLLVAALVTSLLRSKKKASSSGCPGGCAGCAMAGKCHAFAPREETGENA